VESRCWAGPGHAVGRATSPVPRSGGPARIETRPPRMRSWRGRRLPSPFFFNAQRPFRKRPSTSSAQRLHKPRTVCCRRALNTAPRAAPGGSSKPTHVAIGFRGLLTTQQADRRKPRRRAVFSARHARIASLSFKTVMAIRRCQGVDKDPRQRDGTNTILSLGGRRPRQRGAVRNNKNIERNLTNISPPSL